MKKKLMQLTLLLLMLFVLASCDLLSTINAVKGFYTEYQDYSQIYNDASQYTILTETDLTISDDTTAEGLDPMSARVYVMLDVNSPYLYVEQTLNDDSKTSVYEDAQDLYVEYLIDGDVVTPTIPAAEDRYDGDTSANIFNTNFNYDDVDNENKIGDSTYELDVYLNQAINLDQLSGFIDQLSLFGGDVSSFDNAIAHVVVTFTDLDSEIDLQITLDDYQITFEDETSVTLSLSNHTVIKVPEDFQMPDIFSAPYQMVAVDDKELARRVYNADEAIEYPAVNGENGWIQVSLVEGTYELTSPVSDHFLMTVYDPEDNVLTVDASNQFMATEDGNYYIYVEPNQDFSMQLMVTTISTDSGTTTTIPSATTQTTTSE